MPTFERLLDLPINSSNLQEYLKIELQKKENLTIRHRVTTQFDIYFFSYRDTIKESELDIELEVFLQVIQKEKHLHKIVIHTPDENINMYDLDHYFLSNIFTIIVKNDYSQTKNLYTVRIYYYIQHDIGFKGEYIINWKNKIKFKPLFNEKQKNTIAERIITFDIEVEASSLNQARSKGYNTVKEFSSILSVILDIGFHSYDSNFAHFIRKSDKGLSVEFQRKSFFDQELKIFVMDNMNGLRHLLDYQAVEMPTYFSMSFLEANNIDVTETLIQNNERFTNANLEEAFLNHKITKSSLDMRELYSDDFEKISNTAVELKIPRCIRDIFKGIIELEAKNSKKYESFRNCCRLYNLSQTCGAKEPTLMISYLVSAVEALAKGENNIAFSTFMSKYLKEDYDKDFCDHLYGNIRSGHFHSGEFFFNEYQLSLDITFNEEFLRSQKKYLRGKTMLRKAIIAWIKENLLKN